MAKTVYLWARDEVDYRTRARRGGSQTCPIQSSDLGLLGWRKRSAQRSQPTGSAMCSIKWSTQAKRSTRSGMGVWRPGLGLGRGQANTRALGRGPGARGASRDARRSPPRRLAVGVAVFGPEHRDAIDEVETGRGAQHAADGCEPLSSCSSQLLLTRYLICTPPAAPGANCRAGTAPTTAPA